MKSSLCNGLVLVLALTALTACSIVPETEPLQLLDPQPEPAPGFDQPAPWTLDLARPETDPVRDSTRVLVRTEDGRLQSYGRMRWVAPIPELLRRSMIRHWRDQGLAEEIHQSGAGGDRLLAIDLRRFELERAVSGLVAVIDIEVRLHAAPAYAVIFRTRLRNEQSLGSTDPAGVNDAFETLLESMLRSLGDQLRAD